MRGRVVAIGAAVVAVAGLVAVGLLVWPGLPGDDPFRSFNPELQHPSEVTAQLGDPDEVERNCWLYYDRGVIDEFKLCFGAKGRVAWASWSCATRERCRPIEAIRAHLQASPLTLASLDGSGTAVLFVRR